MPHPFSFFRLTACALAALALPLTAAATVPAVVTSDHQALYSGLTNGTGRVSADARGDVFFSDIANNNLDELVAGTTTPVVLVTGMNGPRSVDIDSAGNVYVNDAYTGYVIRVPFVNGSYPTGVTAVSVTGSSSLGIPSVACSAGLQTDCVLPSLGVTVGYYAQVVDTAIDGAGNYYFVDPDDNVSNGHYNRILKLTPSGTVSIIADNLSENGFAQIASDSAGNLYYANSTSLFTIPAGTTTMTAVNTTTLNKPDGVTLDFAGNLIVTDSGNSRFVVMPFENGAINFSHQYLLAPQYSQNSVGIDSFGTIYYSGSSSGTSAINQLQTSTYGAGSLAIGANSTLALFYTSFNATTSFTQFLTHGFGATITQVANSCSTSTTYTANQSCSFNIQIKPNRVGPVSGIASLGDASGNYLAPFVLTGNGLGSAEAIDPGTAAGIGSGFTSPAGVAVDRAGNVFIADSGANAVYELVGGSGTPVSVGTGLSKPDGVAVDLGGNLYIADTGNARVVEIPANGTALSTTQTVIAANLTPPLAISTGPLGSLYIAQAARLARYAVRGIPPATQTAVLSTAFIQPRSLAVDPTGDVFLGDATTGEIVEFANYTGTQTVIASGLTTPTGLATDPAGDLFFVDNGTAQAMRIPNTGGTLNYANAVSLGTFAAPLGLASDASGNLILSDPSVPAVYRITRTTGLVNFGYVNLNTTSPVLYGSLISSGNQSLTLGTPLYTASGDMTHFAISSSGTCTAGQVLATAATCTIGATFTPTAKGVLSEVLALNASPSVATTPFNLTFTGNGTFLEPTTLSVALTSSGTLSYGQTATFTATLTPAAFNVAAATGTVTFTVNGAQQKPVALSNNTASIQISGLSGGVNSVSATYSGDINYAPSTANAIAVTVQPDSSTTSLTISAPYVNPLSSLPGSSVTLTAVVTPSVAGVLLGNVNFVSGATTLGSAPLTALTNGSYQAVLTTTTIPAGSYSVTAVFPGTADYSTSTSTAVPLLVSVASLQLTAGSSAVTSTASTPGQVALTVASVSGFPGNGNPTGAVTFACSGLPANAACYFSPPYLSLAPSPAAVPVAPTAFTLAIAVNVASGATLPPVSQLQTAHTTLLAAFLGLPLLLCLGKSSRSLRRIVLLLFFALLLPAALSLSGCGHGTASATTPKGTYPVTVTASGSTPAGLVTTSLTLNLTVGN
jgi:sugar lactone lactonase YvrE